MAITQTFRNRFILLLCLLPSLGFAQLLYKDVAPIFIRRCTDCHHPGKVFPSFTNYSSVSLYKGIIASNLQSGKMPPWPADTTYTRFSHERVISLAEKAKILNWISAGAPAGDTTIAPPPPRYSKTQLNGTPDLVLSTGTYVSTASLTDKNVCFSLPTGLLQDRVIRAYELVAGNPNMAHHIIMAIDTLGTSVSDLSGSCSASSYGPVMGGWAPGAAPVVFPTKIPVRLGIPIKQGSRLVLQVHYPAGTASLSDSIQLRLYFYPLSTPGIRNITIFAIKNTNFTIDPDSTLTVTGIYPKTGVLQEDMSVFSIFPHSHKICTGIKNFASKGNANFPLCRIRSWNFEWQTSYTFRTLQKVPTGSRFYGQHFYDNTNANPNRSSLPVSAGPGSEDEMLLDMLLCTKYMPGDEHINIDSLISSDSLFMPLGDEEPLPGMISKLSAYPNPFEDQVTISCELLSDGLVSLSVYDMMGRKIRDICSRTESAGIQTYEWDGKTNNGGSAAPGLYMYKLSMGSVEYCGKMLLAPKD